MLIIYFISFLPYVVVVSLEAQLTMWQKTLAVSVNTADCLSLSVTVINVKGELCTLLTAASLTLSES